MAGAMDWLAIPAGTPAKRIANLHGATNAGLLGLSTLNLALRARSRGRRAPLPMLLSAAGTGGLNASAWYGGELVYERGMRVRGVDPVAAAPEVALLPGDQRTAGFLRRLQQRFARAS